MPSRPVVQFLTAVFELRPSQRKAAALERVRAAAEETYWKQLDLCRQRADEIAAEPDRKLRRQHLAAIGSQAARHSLRAGLSESVGAGVARDVEQSVSSYVGLKVKGSAPSWPVREGAVTVEDRRSVLESFVSATTPAHESAARDELARVVRGERLRPFVLVRARDCQIVRDAAGRIAVVLNVVRAKDARAREAVVCEGFDATTGEVINRSKRKTALVVPLSCSRWHENKFLSGKAQLKSSLVVRRGDRWFLCSQFALPVTVLEPSGAALGVDRGCVFPAATAVVGGDGNLLSDPDASGEEVGQTIVRADDRRRRQQRRRGWTSLRHVRAVDHALHGLANDIVAQAREHRAEVVVEKLGEFKRTITARRAKGARKGGWRRVLKKAQLGKLEQILTYKLALAGLPPLREVLAAGTSQTCPACGLRDPKSRAERDLFRCTGCGHELHADANAAILIARRGVLMRTIKKGDKLDALHKDMVAGLRSRDDGGLGPLAFSRRVVAAHASAATANDLNGASASGGLTVAAGQEATFAAENARKGVLAERSGRIFSKAQPPESDGSPKSSPRIGCGEPEDAG
jgi:IS605 OrfB family transposase